MNEENNTPETEVKETPTAAPASAPSASNTAPPAPAEKEDAPVAEASSADASDEEVVVPTKFQSIVREIESMSVLDLHELVKLFEKKFGVSAAAVAAPAAGESEEDDDGGLVTVTLEDAGATKIQVIKIVKEVLGLGLKESKDIVDAAPKPLKEGITKEEAEELKGKLEEVGAKVSVK